MRKFLSVAFLVLFFGSCTRFYYNPYESEYNRDLAYTLGRELKNGVLVVQVPCVNEKMRLMKVAADLEADPKKKVKKMERFEQEIADLQKAQRNLFSGMKKFYTFSEYAFVPDTLLSGLMKGRRDVFIDSTFSFKTIDTEEKRVMLMRDYRAYDDLFIHQLNGQLAPRPFPYSSSVSTGELNIASKKIFGESLIHQAIYIVNKKLNSFYNTIPNESLN